MPHGPGMRPRPTDGARRPFRRKADTHRRTTGMPVTTGRLTDRDARLSACDAETRRMQELRSTSARTSVAEMSQMCVQSVSGRHNIHAWMSQVAVAARPSDRLGDLRLTGARSCPPTDFAASARRERTRGREPQTTPVRSAASAGHVACRSGGAYNSDARRAAARTASATCARTLPRSRTPIPSMVVPAGELTR